MCRPPRWTNRVRVGQTSEPYNSALLDDHVPTAEDLSPVGIAAEGAAVKVSHIKVLRDIYYIAAFNEGKPPSPQFQSTSGFQVSQPDLSDPQNWKMDFSATT